MQTWQAENTKRLLSLSVQEDEDKFCCIALTNPIEVVITDRLGIWVANVTMNGALEVEVS